MNNNILIKYGSTDPDKVLNLMDYSDPFYLPYAFSNKKYDRIPVADLRDQVAKLKLRNVNTHNMYIRMLNKNNKIIDEILNHIDSIVMKD
jgi:hypothetical protein